MDIILLERVEKLGTIGDVVTVKDGYARNFLLPNKKVFEANRERLEEENASKRGEAEKRSEGIDGTKIVLIRASSNSGQLYGSVSVRDIVAGLNEEGADVDKSMIILERPIKTLGIFDVKVVLHPEVHVTVKVNVARSPEEAELQNEGVDVMAEMFDNAPDAGFIEKFDPNAEPGEIASEDDGEAAEAPAADSDTEETSEEAASEDTAEGEDKE